MQKTCPNCGKTLREGYIYCGKCGKAIDEINERPEPKAFNFNYIYLIVGCLIILAIFILLTSTSPSENGNPYEKLILGSWQRDDPGQNAIWKFSENGVFHILGSDTSDRDWYYSINGNVMTWYARPSFKQSSKIVFENYDYDTLILRDTNSGYERHFHKI